MASSARTRRITNELFKFDNDGVSQKLNCYLVNHDESNMRFVRFLPQEYLINIVLKYPNDYPWKPPEIKINGHSYIRLLQIFEQWKLKYINHDVYVVAHYCVLQFSCLKILVIY